MMDYGDGLLFCTLIATLAMPRPRLNAGERGIGVVKADTLKTISTGPDPRKSYAVLLDGFTGGWGVLSGYSFCISWIAIMGFESAGFLFNLYRFAAWVLMDRSISQIGAPYGL